MKKYIVRIFFFFAIVALIDVAFGYACRYLNSHAKGGDTQNHYYIAKECDKDILIFGSSRCMHHYVPKIIEDSLGMSCYNCGVDGNGIVYLYSRLMMMTERYTPKVVIYDIHAGFDVADGDDMKYLKWQKRFYDEPGLKDFFLKVNPMEQYKMCSMLYRYNDDFIQMLSDNIHPIREVEYGGFRPVNKRMKYIPEVKEPAQIEYWDPIKKDCMVGLIEICKEKGIKLIFSYSPCFGGVRPSCDNIIKQFVAEKSLVLLDHYADYAFCMNTDYFYDSVHMNNTGASAYTRMLIGELKEHIN